MGEGLENGQTSVVSLGFGDQVEMFHSDCVVFSEGESMVGRSFDSFTDGIV